MVANTKLRDKQGVRNDDTPVAQERSIVVQAHVHNGSCHQQWKQQLMRNYGEGGWENFFQNKQ